MQAGGSHGHSDGTSPLLPLRIDAVQPLVFIDGGLRSFDTTSEGRLSLPLHLRCLQRSPQLYRILLHPVEAINRQLLQSGEHPLAFPTCLWLRLDPSLNRAPITSDDSHTSFKPTSFFKGKSGFYFFHLLVADLHLAKDETEWRLKLHVLDFLFMENYAADDNDDDISSWAASGSEPRIRVPPPLHRYQAIAATEEQQQQQQQHNRKNSKRNNNNADNKISNKKAAIQSVEYFYDEDDNDDDHDCNTSSHNVEDEDEAENNSSRNSTAPTETRCAEKVRTEVDQQMAFLASETGQVQTPSAQVVSGLPTYSFMPLRYCDQQLLFNELVISFGNFF
jgi:hypothetical protein